MASNQNLGGQISKSLNSPKTNSAPQSSLPSQLGSASSGDYSSQRRGGSGSVGAGSYSKQSASARNNQSRKSHKNTKRFRLDDDNIIDSHTMPIITSRKGQTSITHLMNFSSPRPNLHHHGDSHRRRNGHYAGSGYHAIDKARYVHANYRFVVDPRHSYRAQSLDADEYIDWNIVLQVLVSAQSQSAGCPICLSIPVAPRMAKCGHIFCMSCTLRYMHSENEQQTRSYERKARSKKCPICWENMYLSDLKPVRWYTGQENEPPREGSDVVLRLVKRTLKSTLALPRDGAEAPVKGEDIPWYFAAEVMDYARIMKGTEEYMQAQVERDIAEIEEQERQDELMFGDDTAEWTKRAVKSLKEFRGTLKGIGGPSSGVNTLKDAVPENWEDSIPVESSSGQQPSAPRDAAVAGNVTGLPRQNSMPSQPTTEYYFYQALLHYYLSPLDIRILKDAFGAFSSFPATILPRVERVSTGHVVDDDLRKRAKWLSHLPRGCEVCFLECDWTDTVPAEVLEKYKADIEKRRKRNEEKEAREERARVRAEREEDEKRYAHLRRRAPEDHTPSWFREDDFQPLTRHDTESAEEDVSSTSPPYGNRPQGSPFASLANMSTSPSTSRTVWGTPAIAPSSPSMMASVNVQPVADGWLQDWEKDLLREEEDMVTQAQLLSMSGDGGKPAGGGKKKKKQKITLMSTNVRRGA